MTESASEKVVYFVRHGQSEANVSPVFQGPDSPLSEKGKKQAEQIAERVSHLSFDALISSPYPRTRGTAEAIAKKTGMEPEYSDLFVERMRPDGVANKPYEDEIANKLWRAWEGSLHKTGLKVEGGENFDEIVARADKAMEYLKNRSERSIVVVTHGFFLRVIVARVILGDLLTDAAWERFKRLSSVENTAITVLRYKDAFEEEPCWRVWIYNDHAHLG